MTAYISFSEQIWVAFVVLLHNSVENRAVNTHICRGSVGRQRVRLEGLSLHLATNAPHNSVAREHALFASSMKVPPPTNRAKVIRFNN